MMNNGTTTEQAPVQAGEQKKKKITLATVKSFIRKNSDRLFCKVGSRFDGMTDCVQEVENSFTQIAAENALGIRGVYIVGGSRDHFWAFENDTFTGIEISNCCGRGILAIRK
jgi:hypothetical protein